MRPLLILFFLGIFSALLSQPSTWTPSGIGGGGSLFSPTVSPHDANNMYMQCDMSEVFHTSSGGNTWEAVNFKKLLSTGGLHKVEFTSDPNTLYTVNYSFNDDLQYPVKSIDGGATWNPTSADPTGGEAWFISADPGSSNRLLIASYNRLYFSQNGGNSFTQVYMNSDLYIGGVFWDGSNIFVGTRYGLLISTNNGASFALDASNGIPSGHGFISMTGARNAGVVRLMGTIALQGDLYPGINALDVNVYAGIIRRDYGSGNWSMATTGIPSSVDLFCIASSRSNTGIYYVGGNNTATSYPVVYKTTDGGANWSAIFLTNNNQNVFSGYSGFQGDEDWWYGEIVFGLAVGPNDPNTVIYTDFGFAHVTKDGGTTWAQKYVNAADQNPMGAPTPKDKAYGNNGLENTSCWNLHWMKNNNNVMFASYTDITAVRSIDGGQKWSFSFNNIPYNTVYHVIEHPTNGILYAAVSSVHDIYQSTYLDDDDIDSGTGAILFSSDQGANWQILHNFSSPVIWLAFDSNNANRMYASVINSSSGGIFRSDNLQNGASSTWIKTSNPPRTQGHPYNVHVLKDGSVVSSWSGRRTSNFTASSGIFISANLGTSWTDVSYNPFMHYWTKDITIDPNDLNQNTWYVSVFSGWGGQANDKGGLYKTTNRGTSWAKVFDSYRVESCTVDPVNPNNIYATTESEGLWFTSNGTQASPTFVQQESYNFMHPMRVIYNPADLTKIWVTSFGNGIKNGTAPSIPLPVSAINLKGSKTSSGNLLTWTTENEHNILKYEVEKSSDGVTFEYSGYVPVKAGGGTFRNYEFNDPSNVSDNYYRVKMIEISSADKYSNTVFLNNKASFASIKLIPNPVIDNLNIKVEMLTSQNLHLSVVDDNGMTLIGRKMFVTEGKNEMKVNVSQLPPGAYQIIISDESSIRLTEQFIKN